MITSVVCKALAFSCINKQVSTKFLDTNFPQTALSKASNNYESQHVKGFCIIRYFDVLSAEKTKIDKIDKFDKFDKTIGCVCLRWRRTCDRPEKGPPEKAYGRVPIASNHDTNDLVPRNWMLSVISSLEARAVNKTQLTSCSIDGRLSRFTLNEFQQKYCWTWTWQYNMNGNFWKILKWHLCKFLRLLRCKERFKCLSFMKSRLSWMH